jgi:uncharacterized protein YbjQ (UPF0145 family)
MSTEDTDPQPSRPLVEDEQEQERSLQRVEAGGIPLGAERRLRELGERGGSFTSDLSVGDFALCRQLGLRPLSQVMGSSIYQVGYQQTPWPTMVGGSFMFELETLSDAWNEVRRRSLNRLAQEAGHVGADAVVGVDLRTGSHDWAENAIEYVVIGTAVRHERHNARGTGDAQSAGDAHGTPDAHGTRGGAHGAKTRAGSSAAEPVLTELTVADYAKLAMAGIEPLGVVAWSSVFFVAASYATQRMGGLNFVANQELPEFTQGVYSARETVVERMTAQATAMGASGVIGTRIAHSIQRTEVGGGAYARGGLMVTFHAIGTAIRETEHAAMYAPETTIDLTV